ncbi:MAG: hypothetical protein KDJ37_00760 [Hyphomicrobiaceae bacterium]|nr:hypothetical protein [Hyphomicrobiaceae bacterium]
MATAPVINDIAAAPDPDDGRSYARETIGADPTAYEETAVEATDAEPPSDGMLPHRSASPTAPPRPLRVVSWHLDAARAAGAISIEPERIQVWRHTFGAERRTRSAANFDATSLGADVVLLQGVRRISDARLLFPSRVWRLIVSRQILRPLLSDGSTPPSWGHGARTATTAVAIRYQRRVRITSTVQIGEVVMPTIDPAGPGETAAAIAIRLLVDRRPLWVVSADLPSGCLGNEARAPCPARSQLDRWIGERSTTHEPLVVGGPATGGAIGENSADRRFCSGQSLTRKPAFATAPGSHHPEAGCLARLSLD